MYLYAVSPAGCPGPLDVKHPAPSHVILQNQVLGFLVWPYPGQCSGSGRTPRFQALSLGTSWHLTPEPQAVKAMAVECQPHVQSNSILGSSAWWVLHLGPLERPGGISITVGREKLPQHFSIVSKVTGPQQCRAEAEGGGQVCGQPVFGALVAGEETRGSAHGAALWATTRCFGPVWFGDRAACVFGRELQKGGSAPQHSAVVTHSEPGTRSGFH